MQPRPRAVPQVPSGLKYRVCRQFWIRTADLSHLPRLPQCRQDHGGAALERHLDGYGFAESGETTVTQRL